MTAKPKRLGRGLDFLLPDVERGVRSTALVEIEIARLKSNPWQPRSAFNESAINQLAESIGRLGVIQPITIRRTATDFEIVAGERRVIAARRAGLRTVPSVVRDVSDADMLVAALVENLQREDLPPLDRARALHRLTEDQGKTHEEVATLTGLARSTVTNAIRLLELDDSCQAALAAGTISEGHARALLGEQDLEKRSALLRAAINSNISVRKIEEESRSTNARGIRSRSSQARSADAEKLAGVLRDRFCVVVRIIERGTRGRVVFEYSDLAEFERLFAALNGQDASQL